MAVAMLAAVVAQLPALGDIVSGEVGEAGDSFSWTGLLIVVVGVVVRGNVWAKATVDQVKASSVPPAPVRPNGGTVVAPPVVPGQTVPQLGTTVTVVHPEGPHIGEGGHP